MTFPSNLMIWCQINGDREWSFKIHESRSFVFQWLCGSCSLEFFKTLSPRVTTFCKVKKASKSRQVCLDVWMSRARVYSTLQSRSRDLKVKMFWVGSATFSYLSFTTLLNRNYHNMNEFFNFARLQSFSRFPSWWHGTFYLISEGFFNLIAYSMGREKVSVPSAKSQI